MPKFLSMAFDSASEPNVTQHPPGDLAGEQSGVDLRPELREQKPQRAAPSQPTMSRSSCFLDKWKSRLGPSPLSPGVERRNSTIDLPITASVSQPLSVSGGILARLHRSYAETSALRTHGPSPCDLSALTAGGNITAVPSGDHSSLSFSDVQASSPYSRSKSIASGNPALPSTYASHIPITTIQAQVPATVDVHAAVLPAAISTTVSHVIGPSPQFATVWAKALKLARKKLIDNNLPLLDLTNLTSQPAEENIEAIVQALDTLQMDKKQRWSYTWCRKEVIIAEHLGKILKTAGKYSKAIDAAIQSNPQVSALVWAGVWAIMQVCISFVDLLKLY